MATWGGLTNRCEKKGNEKQRIKGNICPFDAKFKRIARRDKVLCSNQCKEIEEKNRRGKTRDLIKKIKDTKETFHAKMGSVKDRNGGDLKEAEDIRRGAKNTHKNTTKQIWSYNT